MKNAVRRAASLSILLAGIAGAALAQDAGYTPPAKRIPPGTAAAQFTSNAPTPRRADGHVDLSGVWTGNPNWGAPVHELRHPGTLESDQMVGQRGVAWNKPIYKPEFWAKVRELDFSRIDVDPGYNCDPLGVPRAGAPQRILQTDKDVVLIYNDFVRTIPIGAKLTDEDMDQSTYNGISVGKWEGDTLVVDSVGFNDKTWLQFQGYFHTDLMKLRETFRRQGNVLYYTWTIDDPDVLQEPWTQDTIVKTLNMAPVYRNGEPALCVPSDGIPEVDPYNRG